eukprot:1981050-Prymnesium_polylepis.1
MARRDAVCVWARSQVIEVDSIDYAEECCVSGCDGKPDSVRVDRNPCNISLTIGEAMCSARPHPCGPHMGRAEPQER